MRVKNKFDFELSEKNIVVVGEEPVLGSENNAKAKDMQRKYCYSNLGALSSGFQSSGVKEKPKPNLLLTN